MNPFSGFLQPQNNRPLEGLATPQDVLRLMQDNKQLAQRKLENEQQNTRANEYLKLQQGDQAHRFSAEEQKQVEGLLAEYQDAEDQGDPVRLSRAAQMLQRFGMNVGQKQMPDLRAFTGERALPDVKALTGQSAASGLTPENQQAFTGVPQNPIDSAVQQELKSREALRAKNAQPEQDLSQEEWEKQFTENPQPEPSRYEQGGKTTEEYRKMLPQAPEDAPVDMGDVDSPEFQQAAQAEAVDMGDVDSPEFQAAAAAESGQPQATAPRRLPTQLLPTVISKGGKQLYESTGPSGRWSPMVQGVFEPFTQHENPEIASAAKRAQQVAAKLISVDGVAPKDAIKIGMDYLNGEANRTINLERTKLGSRPRGGGGGGGAPAASMKSRKPFNDEMNRTYMQFKSEKLDEQYQGYNAGIGAISSANTASQYDALNRLIQARSGLTVSDKERAIYDNLAGTWQRAVKQFNLMSGGSLPEQYRNQIKTLMSEALRAVVEEKRRRAQAGANFYRAKARGADPGEVEQDAQAVADAIMAGASGGAGDPNADLDQ